MLRVCGRVHLSLTRKVLHEQHWSVISIKAEYFPSQLNLVSSSIKGFLSGAYSSKEMADI